ncbi:MAG: leucine-rich repeat domain-containing protein, partial [Lachnospiraceae bacterium]|nr:leucine-rich repeat domain-containing protein [Lachnospiraceae bacterium]
MKQRRSKLLSLLLTGAMLVSSLPMTGFAEEAAVLSDEIALEDMAEGSGIAEELPDIPEEITFETESTPETEGRTDTETVPAEDVFVDEDGLIEDESPEETLEPETEAETPEEEAETEGEDDLLISDEEPETETLTEEETEELTESETDILEEENLGADLASGSWTYTVSGSYATITGYTGTATTISIPTILGGKTVTAIKAGAFANNTKLLSVSIPATVTAIGSDSNLTGAFQGCKNLQKVTLGSGSGNAMIGWNTFEDCVSLTSIVIPGNYYAVKYDAFRGCISLQSMEWKASTSSYANQSLGDNAFYGCSSLTTVVLPKTLASIGNSAFR